MASRLFNPLRSLFLCNDNISVEFSYHDRSIEISLRVDLMWIHIIHIIRILRFIILPRGMHAHIWIRICMYVQNARTLWSRAILFKVRGKRAHVLPYDSSGSSVAVAWNQIPRKKIYDSCTHGSLWNSKWSDVHGGFYDEYKKYGRRMNSGTLRATRTFKSRIYAGMMFTMQVHTHRKIRENPY